MSAGDPDPPDTTDRLDVDRMPYGNEEVSEYVNDELRSGKTAEELLDTHLDRLTQTDVSLALERLTFADTVNALVSAMNIPDDGVGLPPAQHNVEYRGFFSRSGPNDRLRDG